MPRDDWCSPTRSSLASEAQPDAILDLATLTGAVEVALGNRIAGLMGNDEAWTEQVRAASERAGERVWELPLPDDYRKVLDSDVADMRNVSKTRGGGSIVAGLFLSEFVAPGIPWAHLDIAGTAWRAEGVEGDLTPGGTGWGVRTILELAATFTPELRTLTPRRSARAADRRVGSRPCCSRAQCTASWAMAG